MKLFLTYICFTILSLQNVFGQTNVISNKGASNNIAINGFGNSVGANLANSLYVNSNAAANVGGNSVVSSNIGSVASGNTFSNSPPNMINLDSFITRKEASVANNVGSVTVGVGGQNAATNVNSNLVRSNVNSQNIGLGTVTGNARANSVQLAGSDINFGSVGVGGLTQKTIAKPEEMPVIGYVTFEGYLPVDGTVSVANNNNCGCSG